MRAMIADAPFEYSIIDVAKDYHAWYEDARYGDPFNFYVNGPSNPNIREYVRNTDASFRRDVKANDYTGTHHDGSYKLVPKIYAKRASGSQNISRRRINSRGRRSIFFLQFRSAEKEGLLAVELHTGDRVTLHKTQKYYQQEAELSEHPNTPTLDQSEKSAAEVAKTPWRVSLDKMKEQVASVEYLYPESIPHMTIAVVLLKNGYALQGMSAPADPANFNEEKGREFAYEDALRKLWPLEAYVMRDFLSGAVEIHDPIGRWAAT